MTTKTPKPAPIPDRQVHPAQKKNSTSAKTLPAVPVFQRLKTKEEDEIKSPIQRVKNNTGLPDNLKTGIENLSGFSMDDVKVHYNSDKPAQLNALAYAQGNNIHVAAGQEKHLPHEAWHVVQQKQGRVNATMQMKGIAINDDSALEKEADVMGRKALLHADNNAAPKIPYSRSLINNITQRIINLDNEIVINNEYDLPLEKLKMWKETILRKYPDEKRTGYRRLLDIIWVRENRITDIESNFDNLNFKGTAHGHRINLQTIANTFKSNQPVNIPPSAALEHLRENIKEEKAPEVKKQYVAQNLEHQIEELSRANIDEVIRALKDWQPYIKEMYEKYELLEKETDSKKSRVGKESYYEQDTTESFRGEHKKTIQLATDFYGANNEIKAILKEIESGRTTYHYLIARKDGVIQGLLEKVYKDSELISNIIVNPDNINARPGKSGVKNTLKDLLKVCYANNLNGKNVELTLYALTNRVKKIYDHYGFRVEGGIERPKVDRNKQRWRTLEGKKQTDTLKQDNHPWFNDKNMRITRENQEKFLSS
jgi:hypothetical protein